ncbi:LLM class flavin-dependent oxidoreductase [Frankia sp. Cpl3]|uniref:LLM class flavin-dependent oxidoreductase n=1 Tax=Parafrankia colletiae TaxID=573497 RepID=UPI001F5216B4|nr:LLM class flavin-dependent oxidoreductase [Parafrankia colletiae]MCK9899006.1 LLM class flavin-dependent oxidoreductase [Frankia sp. Cpl3]
MVAEGVVVEGVGLAVALDGCGWHPAAWREPEARPRELFSGRYWTELVQEAEHGRLDFVTIEDTLALQSSGRAAGGQPDEPDGRVDEVRGRLDAVLIAARVAPLTRGVGLVPTIVVTHTEPFHISKAIATLDFASAGRAGVRVRIAASGDVAAHFGRRDLPGRWSAESAAELFDEAADYVEVVRRLWDSWEDDAEIRDVATGRFIDREKLHYIDFAGRWFTVRGPSIVPRPPQGQPLVTALAHDTVPYRFAARAADLVHVTPRDARDAARISALVRAEWAAAGRPETEARLFADLVVFLDEDGGRAAERRQRLDERSGPEREFRSDAQIFVGTPSELADLLAEWADSGIDGFQLRPAVLPTDLRAITRGLVPELRRRGLFRDEYRAATLRGRLGLDRPANRYAPTGGVR